VGETSDIRMTFNTVYYYIHITFKPCHMEKIIVWYTSARLCVLKLFISWNFCVLLLNCRVCKIRNKVHCDSWLLICIIIPSFKSKNKKDRQKLAFLFQISCKSSRVTTGYCERCKIVRTFSGRWWRPIFYEVWSIIWCEVNSNEYSAG